LVPQVDPVQQADDVARALAIAQVKVQSLGGDPSKFILMGHSSGAHLVAMLASAPSKAYSVGVKPWLGTILLDSAALNVKTIMEKKHYKFYDAAFGADPKYWQSVSPIDMLTAPTAPILAVCSLRREDSAQEAKAFVSKAVSLGIKARVLEEDFSHKDINVELGKPGAYTSAVEEFMASLDPLVKDMLANSK
jgi:acetyl esterase/lipase